MMRPDAHLSGNADAAAYGGPRWAPRVSTTAQEIGRIWGECGVDAEWTPLRAVLLHRPGRELTLVRDADAAQMIEIPLCDIAAAQHDALADTFRSAGVAVHYVDPPETPPPNLMFAADLFFMTPAGAIVARPASTVRAGEERWIARRLADLGVPILRTVSGTGTFEGADAMWLDPETAVIGVGLRTNTEGAAQVAATLAEQGVHTIIVQVPYHAMHLMAQLRIIDRNLAFVQADAAAALTDALRTRGYDVRGFPDAQEVEHGFAYNFVTLAPRRIVMPAGNPVTAAAFHDAGIECMTVDVGELTKAAGAIACLTGVMLRDRASAA